MIQNFINHLNHPCDSPHSISCNSLLKENDVLFRAMAVPKIGAYRDILRSHGTLFHCFHQRTSIYVCSKSAIRRVTNPQTSQWKGWVNDSSPFQKRTGRYSCATHQYNIVKIWEVCKVNVQHICAAINDTITIQPEGEIRLLVNYLLCATHLHINCLSDDVDFFSEVFLYSLLISCLLDR